MKEEKKKDSIILKEDKEHRIVMYGFKDSRSLDIYIWENDLIWYDWGLDKGVIEPDLIFFGDKLRLLEKDEIFWKELVEQKQNYIYAGENKMPFGHPFWKNYGEPDCISTPLESGHSALSQIPEPYILIVKELK